MSITTKEAQLQKLVETFKASLDEALVVAIACDYDLQDPSAYDLAYTSLKSLAQDALAEEATGFNPSGVSEPPEGLGAGVEGDETDSSSLIAKSVSQQASQTQNTEPSNPDSSHSSSDAAYVIPRLTSFSEDSEDDKIAQLKALFPDIKDFDVKFYLGKANGDFQTALDELLSLQDRQSSGQMPKGIDGFLEDEPTTGGKKGKKKGRGKAAKMSSLGQPHNEFIPPEDSRETKHQEEVSYIADRISFDYNEISEIHKRKKHSIGATVAEILEMSIEAGISPENETSEQQKIRELEAEYRNIPVHYLPTLVHMALFEKAADDLAAHLSKHFAKNPWTQKLDLSYSLTSLPHDIEGSTAGASAKAASQKTKLGVPLDLPPISLGGSRNLAHVLQTRDLHSQARRDASLAATKMAKSSSPLMRQGAGIYAERAREHGRSAWQATSDAADILVERNRTRDTIDLHGVYVQDGVRIARQSTYEWWQSLGEYKASKAKMEPFTVVTGVGRHSAGGFSQMRKAVAAALIQDGWKMQIEGGKFVITGRR